MSNINEKNQGPRWYVAHTYTGYENKVKDSIEKIVENRGLGHLIYDIKVPCIRETVLDESGKPIGMYAALYVGDSTEPAFEQNASRSASIAVLSISDITQLQYTFNNATIGQIYLDDISLQRVYVEGNNPIAP